MSKHYDPAVYRQHGFVTSPSQVATYSEVCPRRWAFQSLWRLPQPQEKSPSTVFGEVVHEVLARWAMQQEPYPPGWDRALPLGSSEPVRQLVRLAIERGVAQRHPGRRVEHKLTYPVVDADSVVHGSADVYHDGGVADHKTTSSPRHALDEAELAEDVKMLCYAVGWMLDHPGEPTCELRLNYLATTKSGEQDAWPVVAPVSRERVERFSREVLEPTISGMLALRDGGLTEDDWRQVEGPRSRDACRLYPPKGCPYATICGGGETPAQLRARLSTSTKPSEAKKVSIFDDDSPTAPVVSAPPAAQAAPPEATTAPPWHVPGCAACKASPGWVGDKVCRACDLVSQRRGGPTSDRYEVDAAAKTWRARQTPTPPAPAPVTPPAEPQAKKARKQPKPELPKPAEPTSEQPAEPTSELPTAKKFVTLEESRRGPILCISCLPVKMSALDLTEILKNEQAALAEQVGAESYDAIDMDVFRKRGAVASRVEALVANLGCVYVVAPADGNPDYKDYLTHFRAHVSEKGIVIVGSA